jgi:exodeoxyribonuclease VII large subunit
MIEVDLFSTPDPKPSLVPAGPRVVSVSQLTREVLKLIEGGLGTVWVEGEVSNLRRQASGHQYFTLKDAAAQLSCVLFGRVGASVGGRSGAGLSDGMQVRLFGLMTVYEARGQYQLKVQKVEAAGTGLLLEKFEALKRKLELEGLFEQSRKRVAPSFPSRIAIVTSPSGAVVQDMLNILGRRAPWLKVMISPVRVQGQGAAAEIVAALQELNRAEGVGLPRPDVIVLARGGGSIEDLWEFNEEALARAIADSAIPVVSAVGHEVDFTIADFVADLRAPTPSAAAELLAPDTAELLRSLSVWSSRLGRAARQWIAAEGKRVEYLGGAALFSEPRRRLQQAAQSVDLVEETLERTLREGVAERRRHLVVLESVLLRHRPDQVLALQRERLRSLGQRLEAAVSGEVKAEAQRLSRGRERLCVALPPRLAQLRQRWLRVSDMLRLLAPQRVLERGFSITRLEDGTVLRRAADAAPGVRLRTLLSDGEVESRVAFPPEGGRL